MLKSNKLIKMCHQISTYDSNNGAFRRTTNDDSGGNGDAYGNGDACGNDVYENGDVYENDVIDDYSRSPCILFI